MIAGPPFLLEFGEQKLKHESMNATNAQNPNKCPAGGRSFPSFFLLQMQSRECNRLLLQRANIIILLSFVFFNQRTMGETLIVLRKNSQDC